MKRSVAAIATAIALGTSSVVAPSNSPILTAPAMAAEQLTQADLYEPSIYFGTSDVGPEW